MSVDTIPKSCAVCSVLARHAVLATLDGRDGLYWVCADCADQEG